MLIKVQTVGSLAGGSSAFYKTVKGSRLRVRFNDENGALRFHLIKSKDGDGNASGKNMEVSMKTANLKAMVKAALSHVAVGDYGTSSLPASCLIIKKSGGNLSFKITDCRERFKYVATDVNMHTFLSMMRETIGSF